MENNAENFPQSFSPNLKMTGYSLATMDRVNVFDCPIITTIDLCRATPKDPKFHFFFVVCNMSDDLDVSCLFH